MILVLKVILGILGLLLFVLAGRWIFATKGIATEHGIEYSSATGGNYLKGDIGGVLLMGAAMVPLFLFQDRQWFYPIVLLLICVIFARVVSLITDGYSKQGMTAIIVEILMIAVAYGVYAL